MISYPFAELDRFFSQSTEPFGLIDPHTQSVLYANNAFAARLQALQMASGKSPLREWPELQTAIASCVQSTAMSTYDHARWNVHIELLPVQLVHADGSSSVVVQCKPLYLRQHENDELVYRHLLENAPHSSWACTVNGEVFWTNRASNQFAYGHPIANDSTNADYLKKIHPDDLQHTSTLFCTGMVEGQVEPFRYRLRDHMGQYYWFLFTASPVREEDGTIRYWTGSSINIHQFVEQEQHYQSEIKRLQSQLQNVHAVASTVQKRELITHLAGGVAHDLNNLLFVMSMHMSRLNEKVAGEHLTSHVQAVRESIRKAARMSSQLSGFSGRFPQNAVALNPAKVMEEAQSLFVQAVGAEVDFHVQIDANLDNLLVDRTYLENALINLLINARDAMDGRGTITLLVHAHPEEVDGKWHPFVAFTVTDQGIGISPEMQERIFEPFFTTKSPEAGSGLGLPMVKSFVESSGGKIVVASRLNEGTSVSLILPTTTQAVMEELPSDGETVLRAKHQAAVLLVEDDEAVRQTVSLVLKDLGYAILAAPSPEMAIHLLESGLRADVIVSDIRMPGKKSVQDLIAYVEAHHAVPMIFITGYSANVVIREGLIDGRYPVLFKPFGLDELVHKIDEEITKRQ